MGEPTPMMSSAGTITGPATTRSRMRNAMPGTGRPTPFLPPLATRTLRGACARTICWKAEGADATGTIERAGAPRIPSEGWFIA